MTFSTRPIIDLVQKNFVPVWESVAPVSTATFDLGDGKELKGTVGGEIAIYFCRPDGTVFDILPALQSPAATRLAIEEALAFYRQTDAKLEDVQRYHGEKFAAGLGPAGNDVTWREFAQSSQLSNLSERTWRDFPHKKHLEYRRDRADAGTRSLGEMSLSKTLVVTPKEEVLVVEPGGRELYEHRLHQRFSVAHALVPPSEWKSFLFEEVLGHKLEGGNFRYDSKSLTPFSVMPD